ncbi:hypothetical protein SynA1562_00614 [Synechococcus sp. A15-62]|uniref:YceD family protein n=1 Tax=Synechococcus sp. A15-62 TaxID=1050657 RepID=UPI00164503D7|nr:DUF177 domain-containing protein [Synechococcus sp. A15-62]QNI99459.1 hypothetical protein SynA1562_00614 [Synechococcus sp. A15-62]
MIEALEPVPLQELRALGTAKVWDVEGELDELPSLTLVRGHVSAEHRGNVLAVEGKLSTIVTLCCDRCLNQFNQSLSCTPSELIWLGDKQPTADELELSGEVAEMEGLVDVLDPRGQFDPQQWAFEQLNLLLPVVNYCGDHCPGPPGLQQQPVTSDANPKDVDPRWQALQQLQQQIDQP